MKYDQQTNIIYFKHNIALDKTNPTTILGQFHSYIRSTLHFINFFSSCICIKKMFLIVELIYFKDDKYDRRIVITISCCNFIIYLITNLDFTEVIQQDYAVGYICESSQVIMVVYKILSFDILRILVSSLYFYIQCNI